MAQQPIDVKLSPDDEGIWDISLDENGDLEKDYGFGTTIAQSIFGQKRATAAEVPTPQYRGGWIGSLLPSRPGFEGGSKSWLRKQSRLTPETATGVRNDDQEALNWFVEDGLAKSIVVNARQNGASSILEKILIDGEPFFFDVWNNTIVEI